MKLRVLVAIAACSLAIACKGKTTGGGNDFTPCVTYNDCEPGAVCVDGKCAAVCITDEHCPAGYRCDGGSCQQKPPPGLLAPIIETVNGTGSIDTTSGHTERHLRDRLVITGQNLLLATITLTGVSPTTPAATLPPCSTATDTHLEVAMPTDLQTGTYTLTAVNQAGACNATLSLLQGEPGSLSASGADIVVSINNAIAVDPTLNVRGALNGQVTTLVATSSTTATDRQILVNGADQVDSPLAGLYLSVIDLTTHQVVDTQATTLFRTKQAFQAGLQLQHDGLRDVLDTLTASEVIILVSTGDITAMAADTALAAKLKLFGASSAFDAVAANQGYVLVGRRDVGEGNGLEGAVAPGSAALVTISTVIVDQGVIGMTMRSGTPAGTIAFFAGTCPSGWSEYSDAAGRVVVGLPSGGTAEGLVGTPLGNLAARTIANVAAHTHAIDPPSATSSTATDHTHAIDPPSTASGAVTDHTHGVDPPATTSGSSGDHTHTTDPAAFNSVAAGDHVHSVDPPSTSTGSAAGHVHSGSGINTAGAYGTVGVSANTHTHTVDIAAFNSALAGSHTHSIDVPSTTSSTAGAHTHSTDIALFTSGAGGGHSHAVDIASFASAAGGSHSHTTDIASFTSGSAGTATVDVTMPYVQLRACRKD